LSNVPGFASLGKACLGIVGFIIASSVVLFPSSVSFVQPEAESLFSA
jgi:hypothetical protein